MTSYFGILKPYVPVYALQSPVRGLFHVNIADRVSVLLWLCSFTCHAGSKHQERMSIWNALTRLAGCC